MTTATIVTRNKDTPSSKVGVVLTNENNKIKIVRVEQHGLFAGSGVQAGQELLSINGENVRGKSLQEVIAILASLPREVTLQTSPGEQNAWLECILESKEKLLFDENKKHHLPSFLAYMGVPHGKWNRLVNAFANDLIPAIEKTLKIEKVLRVEMVEYTKKQFFKGDLMEGQHQKKVLMMTHQAAIQQNNLNLVASNVVSIANALLNKYGVLAELKFSEIKLPNYSSKQQDSYTQKVPSAIRFSPIDADGEETPSSSPPVAIAVIDD